MTDYKTFVILNLKPTMSADGSGAPKLGRKSRPIGESFINTAAPGEDILANIFTATDNPKSSARKDTGNNGINGEEGLDQNSVGEQLSEKEDVARKVEELLAAMRQSNIDPAKPRILMEREIINPAPFGLQGLYHRDEAPAAYAFTPDMSSVRWAEVGKVLDESERASIIYKPCGAIAEPRGGQPRSELATLIEETGAKQMVRIPPRELYQSLTARVKKFKRVTRTQSHDLPVQQPRVYSKEEMDAALQDAKEADEENDS